MGTISKLEACVASTADDAKVAVHSFAEVKSSTWLVIFTR